jgi:hypothetical protein
MFMFYAITVPTTIYNRIAPAAKVDALRSEVKAALADAFGGYTETVGTGGYKAESGELIEETIYQIEAFTDKPDEALILALAERIKAELLQESVMVTIDKDVRFV